MLENFLKCLVIFGHWFISWSKVLKFWLKVLCKYPGLVDWWPAFYDNQGARQFFFNIETTPPPPSVNIWSSFFQTHVIFQGQIPAGSCLVEERKRRDGYTRSLRRFKQGGEKHWAGPRLYSADTFWYQCLFSAWGLQGECVTSWISPKTTDSY